MADVTLPDASTVLPANADPTIASSLNPLTAQYGSAALPASINNAIQPPKTIDPSTLGSQSLTIPTTPNNTNDFVQSLSTGTIQGLEPTQQLQTNVTNAQGEVDQTTSEINQLLGQLGMKSQETGQMQQAVGIPQLQQNLQDLNTQFAQKKSQYDLAQQKIASQPLETGFILGQTGILQAQKAVELGALSAQIQAAQGNLQSAFNTINQTINQKYQPIIDQLNAKKEFYAINKDKLTQAQARLATRQQAIVTAQAAQAQNAYKVEQDAATAISNAIKSGFVDATAGFQAITDMATGAKPLPQISKELGISLNGGGGAGSGATNVANALGVQNTTVPLSVVVNQVGLDKFADAVISNEGSSPAGVKNNPGNIKFMGLPGQTDSGVKASDGGTFANYATLAQGKQAIKDIIENAAEGKSQAYGVNPTFEEFMNKYTNTQPSQVRVPGITGSNSINTQAPGYSTAVVPNSGGLTQAAIDQKAMKIALGQEPTPKGGTGASLLQNRAVLNRVGELNANQNIATNKAKLVSLQSSLETQQKYSDSLERSLNNADHGFNQVLATFNNKGINQFDSPIANIIANKAKYALGPGDLAAFQAGMQEVANEYQQVFSRGGQVTDTVRNTSSKIANGDLSINDLKGVMKELQAQGQINKQGSLDQINKITGQIDGILRGSTQTESATSTPNIEELRKKYNY